MDDCCLISKVINSVIASLLLILGLMWLCIMILLDEFGLFEQAADLNEFEYWFA